MSLLPTMSFLAVIVSFQTLKRVVEPSVLQTFKSSKPLGRPCSYPIILAAATCHLPPASQEVHTSDLPAHPTRISPDRNPPRSLICLPSFFDASSKTSESENRNFEHNIWPSHSLRLAEGSQSSDRMRILGIEMSD